MNENVQKWLDALRSGDYEQGKSALRSGDQYCCLGVACEVYRKETGQGEWQGRELAGGVTSIWAFRDGYDESSLLPSRVREWLGIKTVSANFNRPVLGNGTDDPCYTCYTLTDLNDCGDYTFTDIADFIETKPEGLFDE